MVPFVQSNQVITRNNEVFAWPNYPNGLSGQQIPVDGTVIVNSFWRLPRTLGNRVIGYDEQLATTATKPRADAVKVLRVKDASNTVWEFAITDDDNIATTTPANQFAFLSNGLGGTLPTMPAVTIPYPIMQTGPQSVVAGDNVFVFAFPANPNTRLYSILFPWFNGAAPTQAYEPAGITTPAQFVTWANTSGKWDGYGTWSSSGTVVFLNSNSADTIFVEEAGIQIALTPANYCLTLNASADAVNGIKIDGAIMPIPAIMAGRTNRAALIQEIQKYFPGGVFTTAITNKINVLTIRLPQDMRNDGVAVSGLTWSAGVCS